MIDDMFFIMHAGTSELHSLNAVGARIWDLVDGQRSVSDIVTVIRDEYDVGPDAAEEDVLEFLAALESKDLVSL